MEMPHQLHPSVSIPPPDPPKYLQEDDLTQECKDLISTLPTQRGWVATHLHQYQGFWHNSRQLQGVVSCQKHFKALDTDIILVTTPKSGTTWLKAITFALQNRHTYPMGGSLKQPLLTSNPHFLVPFLELNLYVEKDFVPDLSTFPSPRLFSTHLPYVSLPPSVKDTNCRIVYLCREPKDAFVSLWHFTNKIRPKNNGTNNLEEAFEKFCRGVSLCGPFWDHILGYWEESLKRPEKVMFLKFEEMKENQKDTVKSLAKFMACPISAEEESDGVLDDILKLCSFEHLSNLEVNKTGKMSSGEEHRAFFRRGEVGDWKNHLTIEMEQKINSITKDKLGCQGFKF